MKIHIYTLFVEKGIFKSYIAFTQGTLVESKIETISEQLQFKPKRQNGIEKISIANKEN